MTPPLTVHATAVAILGRGVMIRGRAGAGKSALALSLMAHGATLIADDQVTLTRSGTELVASCPASLHGLIEARGIGLLRADMAGPTALACVVDLDEAERDRLPHPRVVTLLGCALPLLHRTDGLDLAPALIQFMKAGRMAP